MSTHIERAYHVMIVGSGSSGFFAAASPLTTTDASKFPLARKVTRGWPRRHSNAA